MAKTIKYNLCVRMNRGTEETPLWEETLSSVETDWNEINEEIARKEAWGGEYLIEDDGVEESTEPTTEERVEELEEALDMLLLGVTE